MATPLLQPEPELRGENKFIFGVYCRWTYSRDSYCSVREAVYYMKQFSWSQVCLLLSLSTGETLSRYACLKYIISSIENVKLLSKWLRVRVRVRLRVRFRVCVRVYVSVRVCDNECLGDKVCLCDNVCLCSNVCLFLCVRVGVCVLCACVCAWVRVCACMYARTRAHLTSQYN